MNNSELEAKSYIVENFEGQKVIQVINHPSHVPANAIEAPKIDGEYVEKIEWLKFENDEWVFDQALKDAEEIKESDFISAGEGRVAVRQNALDNLRHLRDTWDSMPTEGKLDGIKDLINFVLMGE